MVNTAKLFSGLERRKPFLSKQVREKSKHKLKYVGKNKLKPTCLIRKEHLSTALPFQQVLTEHESQQLYLSTKFVVLVESFEITQKYFKTSLLIFFPFFHP